MRQGSVAGACQCEEGRGGAEPRHSRTASGRQAGSNLQMGCREKKGAGLCACMDYSISPLNPPAALMRRARARVVANAVSAEEQRPARVGERPAAARAFAAEARAAQSWRAGGRRRRHRPALTKDWMVVAAAAAAAFEWEVEVDAAVATTASEAAIDARGAACASELVPSRAATGGGEDIDTATRDAGVVDTLAAAAEVDAAAAAINNAAFACANSCCLCCICVESRH